MSAGSASSLINLPEYEDWEIAEERPVGGPRGHRLTWLRVFDNSALGSTWHAYVVDENRRVLSVPAWAPLPGSQSMFLTCPIFEAMAAGNRGSGKSEVLLIDFAREVKKGWGPDWRGILFRRHMGDLDEMVRKAKILYGKLYGGHFRFLNSKGDYKCVWDTGEELLFRHLFDITEYANYHGHQYPWIGFEELTQWPDDKVYRKMFSCCRPTAQGIPTRVRANTNPSGVGHHWVKARFDLPDKYGKVLRPPRSQGRVAICLDLRENFPLLHSDPGYMDRIIESAETDAEAAAWSSGDWNITSGGMFDDVWQSEYSKIGAIDPTAIPRGWRINRSYDHGQAKPFFVGWWAESNGEPIWIDGRPVGSVRGDLILIREWYGNKPGFEDTGVRMSTLDIAQGILDREEDWGIRDRVLYGPADTEIWAKDNRGTLRSPLDDFEDILGEGCFEQADKTPGSRKRGLQQIRTLMKKAAPDVDGTRDSPGLFVCDCCTNWLRLVPSVPRDSVDQDEIPAKYEDHPIDGTRYRITFNYGFVESKGF